MNKVIIGGILVTMMGGTPTATYFLTKEGKDSVVVTNKEELRDQADGESGKRGTDCATSEDQSNCPKAQEEPESSTCTPEPCEA